MTAGIKNKKSVLYTILSIFCMCSVLFIIYFINKEYKFFLSPDEHPFYVVKRYNYIAEKMIRFYNLKGKTPYILTYNAEIFGNHDSIYIPMYPIKGYNNCTKENEYFRRYYNVIYKKQPSDNIAYCTGDDALERFYKEGGVFYKYELDDIFFSRLFNDDFVLNKSLRIDEIYKNNYVEF